MPWNDYFLWAGLCLLCLDLFHFSHQRKLHDHRTILLYAMTITSLCICGSGIILTHLLSHRLSYTLPGILMTILIYISQWLLPYLLLCMICCVCSPALTTPVYLGLVPLIAGFIVILSNPVTGFISGAESDGLLHVSNGYPVFVYGIMLWYFFDFIFILFHFKKLKLRQIITLGEVSIFLLTGMLLQNILRLNLFVGFAAALAIFSIHFSLNSPYAYTDYITRLFNQDYFIRWISERYAQHRSTSIMIVEFTQLDHLHTVYDLAVGKQLLSSISDILWRETPDHAVFRINYRKYLLCTRNAAQQQLLLSRLQQIFHQEFEINQHKIICPAAFCLLPDIFTCTDADTLWSYIQFMLRQTNDTASASVLMDSHDLFKQYNYELEVERFLNIAVEKDLFEVWYQPIWNIKNQAFVAMEALSRLKHPTLGWISPEFFFHVAQKTDLIFKILPLQLKKICDFVKQNPSLLQSTHNIKINLSPAELIKPGYCDMLIEIIQSYGLSPAFFQFEVTETTATQYNVELSNCILRLQKTGIRLCLDDFGSGYANLNSILRLPFSVIKLDRSLLSGITSDTAASTFYQSMVHTLKSIGYQIVAEGVETGEEARLLSEWNVDMIQGYYYAKPMPGNDVLSFTVNKEAFS